MLPHDPIHRNQTSRSVFSHTNLFFFWGAGFLVVGSFFGLGKPFESLNSLTPCSRVDSPTPAWKWEGSWSTSHLSFCCTLFGGPLSRKNLHSQHQKIKKAFLSVCISTPVAKATKNTIKKSFSVKTSLPRLVMKLNRQSLWVTPAFVLPGPGRADV